MKIGILLLGTDDFGTNRLTRSAEQILNTFPPFYQVEMITPAQIESVDLPLSLIQTGGCEHQFKTIHPALEKLNIPITLMAPGSNNALPAALEILAWLRSRGDMNAVLLHGRPEEIHHELALRTRLFHALKEVKSARFGILGGVSDWLIASGIDTDEVARRWGCSFRGIPFEEFEERYAEVKEKDIDKATPLLKNDLAAHGPTETQIREALRVYIVLERIAQEQHLTGLTVKCFDLIEKYATTACLGLAVLNDSGICAGCEGDVPALLTMAINRWLTDLPAFMANPSRIDKDGIIFAHCSAPMKILNTARLRTHFESGKGVAIEGRFTENPMTISRIGGNHLQWYYVAEGRVIDHGDEESMCRTQVKIAIKEGTLPLLSHPLGNHHILSCGKNGRLFADFMKLLNSRPVDC